MWLGLGITLITLAAIAAAQAGFITAPIYPAGRGANSLALGDLNGDGVLDIAMVGEKGVNILLGNGDGTFRAGQDYAAGFHPISVAIGDFNGDGHLDLAVANHGDPPNPGTVSILLGNGDGTFQAATDYLAGTVCYHLTVGDFNGDGFQDIVVANRIIDGGEVNVLLGNGDGTFQPAQSYRAGPTPQFVAVGDFNGDGILDLAVTNFYGGVSVLLGNGDGSFKAPHSYAIGSNSTSVGVGDFNGDGILDLAVTDIGTGTGRVLLGKGDGTFEATGSFAVGNDAILVAVGDLNGDGHLDLALAVGGSASGGGLSVLLGKGDGTFPAAPSFAVQPAPASVAVGDFNGDGIPDLAVATYSAVSVWLGNGDGTFRSARTLSSGPGGNSIAVGDFNGDGKVDIVTTNYDIGNPPRRPGTGISQIRVFLGNGDGTFQRAIVYKTEPGPQAVAVADFNGDGIPDLAVAIGGRYAQPVRTVSILLGNGDGTFQPAQSYAAGLAPRSVAIGDFNGDGIPDLAVANYLSNTVSILLGNGDGTFQAAQDYDAGPIPISVAVGDFNGDGILDLAVADFAFTPQGTVSVLLGNGDGSFQRARGFSVGFIPVSVAVADFDKDGYPDLVVVNRDSGTVSILLGKGDGTFHGAQDYAAGTSPFSVAVADLNGDGYPDLAVVNYKASSVTVLLNDAVWP